MFLPGLLMVIGFQATPALEASTQDVEPLPGDQTYMPSQVPS